MKQFDELWEVSGRLNGPKGCPWDLKQTFFSLQRYVLEEAHEVVEAVDRGVRKEIIEELGDLLFTVLFYAQIAQKKGEFSLEDILETIKEKMIRRHPHVFGDTLVESEEDVIRNWDVIKKEQEGKNKQEFLKDLPALTKAHTMAKVFHKKGFSKLDKSVLISEEEIASCLWQLVEKAEASGMDSEGILRRSLLKRQEAFQHWEALHERTE
jgi:tetrapyrrole methylase family protein/MazG family protein